MNKPFFLRILTTTLAGVMGMTLVACSQSDDTASMPAPSTTTTVGTQIDDSVVTARVKTALLADPSIQGLNISVNTQKGEVQLSGVVDSQSQIDRAVEVAHGADGVTQVGNDMSVKK